MTLSWGLAPVVSVLRIVISISFCCGVSADSPLGPWPCARAVRRTHTHSHIYIFMYMGFPTRPSVDVRPVQALLGPDQRMGRLRPCQERVIQTLTRFTRRWVALAGVPRGGGFTAMEACQRVIRSMQGLSKHRGVQAKECDA